MSLRRNRRDGFETRAIHEGHDPAEAKGAVMPPVYLTSTYAFEDCDSAGAIQAGEREGFVYGRTKNPTQAVLEQRLASLEGGEAAVAAASGMAAIAGLIWTQLRPGDRLVAHRTLYGNSYMLIAKELPELGFEVELADLTNPAEVERAVTPGTKLVFFETPANPNVEVINIALVSAVARRQGALTVVDNTFASPYLQRPLELGADAVVHSMTKFLGGHSDVLAGALIGPEEMVSQARMRGLRYLTGATISPFTCFLVMRGLMTLGVRMERHSANAQALAEMLEAHPKVASVSYPGLASHPAHALAERQMSGPGGLLAFEVAGGLEAGRRTLDGLRLVARGVSLGGCESLAQHPASMTHAGYDRDSLRAYGMTEGMIRVSVGIETLDDLLEDFEQALAGA